MKSIQNFFLMLKQGVKGVFKFKAQFTIILILSFIATMILSVSVSTERRINDSYNQVVRSIDRFDYSGDIEVGSSNQGSNEPLLISEAVDNADSTIVQSYSEQNGVYTKASSVQSYNFVFSNVYNEKRYNNIFSNVIGSEDGKKTVNENDVNSMIYKLNDLFVIEGLNELATLRSTGDVDSSIKYSLFGLYTKQVPNWFDDFVNFDANGKVISLKKDYQSQIINGLDTKFIWSYYRSSIAKTSSFLYHMSNDRVSSLNLTTKQAYAFFFGVDPDGTMINDSKAKNWIVDNKNVKPFSLKIENNANADGERKTKDDFVMLRNDKSNSSSTYDASDDVIAEALKVSGMRGITNPFYDSYQQDKNDKANSEDAKTDFSTIKSFDYYEPFIIFDPAATLNGNLNLLGNYYDDYWFDTEQAIKGTFDDWSFARETIFLTSQKMAATAAGFDYNIRREIVFYDPEHKVKYRNIIYNDNELYNLTTLKGKRGGSNDVMISEQFARKNNIKIGSRINVGNTIFTITGYATDAFSYMPSQDKLNPLPNPAVSAFLFINADSFSKEVNGNDFSSKLSDSANQDISYILWNKEDESTKEARMNLFKGLQMYDQTTAKDNSDAIMNYVNGSDKTSINEMSTNFPLVTFDKSDMRYSWMLQPLVFNVYAIVTYAAAAVIAVIAIIALAFCVKKTIGLNAKQIGILKAMGETPKGISVSYISYSLIITFIIVPVAWVVGVLLQIPFANMFLTYFSAAPDEIMFDWIPLVISLGILGLLSGIIAFFTAYRLTNKPVIEILSSSVTWGRIRFLDWLKEKVFAKAKFSTRFSMTLTSSGSRQIILMTVVVFITSVLISAALAIPSVAFKANDLYYKSVKYANKYDEVPLTMNAPLSKNVLSYWNGHEELDKEWVDGNIQLDNSDNRYGYYKDTADYTSTINGSSTIAPYLYTSKYGPQDSYDYIMHDSTNLLPVVSSLFGNNFYNNMGVSFSVGMIDKFFGLILHSYDNLTSEDALAQGEVHNEWTDEQKLQYARDFSSWLTQSIPNIISAIVASTGDGGAGSSAQQPTGDETWKDQVMNAIYSAIPPYVKAYVQQSQSRLDQFGISYQTELYQPSKETLITNVTGNADNYNDQYTITGIDKNQNSIVIDDELKDKAFFDENTKQKIYDVMDNKNTSQDIMFNGEKIYDHNTNVLTVPVIPNKQAESAFHLKKDEVASGWTNKVQQMQYNTKEGFKNLPKAAWQYDDSDYIEYVNSKNNKTLFNPKDDKRYTKSESGKYYLNAYNMDNNKFTYHKTYDYSENGGIDLDERSYMFSDWKYDQNNKPIGSYIRPYYKFKDIKLFIPENQIKDLDDFLYIDQSKVIQKNDKWFRKDVSLNDVPQSVIEGYENEGIKIDGQTKFLEINPYDITYADPNIETKNEGSELKNLVDSPPYWYRYVIRSSSQPISVNINDDMKYANKGLKIDLKSVGSIDSYNDKLVLFDSDIANRMLNYSNARSYQYDYNPLNTRQKIPAGVKAPDGTISDFDRYGYKDARDYLDVDDVSKVLWKPSYEFSGDIRDYAGHYWYNGKLSNDEEPTSLTSQISFVAKSRLGQNAIGLGRSTIGDTVSMISSQVLLSESKALIKQVSMLAVAIGAMLIVAIIITASLLIMLTGDIYIAQYQRFMVLMRALGYSNKDIITYTFGTVAIFSFGAWAVGTVAGWLAIYGGIIGIWNAGFALPMVVTWWPIVLSFAIMLISFVGSLTVSSSKARKEKPSVLLTATAE